MASYLLNKDHLTNDLDLTKLVELVRIAETAECYDDMHKFVKEFIELKIQKGEALNLEERNLFKMAYKYVIGSKRASWRSISYSFNQKNKKLMNKYKGIIEDELEIVCIEVLELTQKLHKTVEGNANETEIFFLKMCGDWNKYLCEIRRKHESFKTFVLNSQIYYEKALKIAEENLAPIDSTRLGVALDYSVFCYDILNEKEKAFNLAKRTFEEALKKIEELDAMGSLDDVDKDSLLIMQMLRDNMKIWDDIDDDDGYNNDNDGIDITKYGKTAKEERHDPNNAASMHELKAEMKKLGLMPQNMNEETHQSDHDDAIIPMDEIRDNLYEIFININNNESIDNSLYKEVIDLILEYEAYIDLSRFKCRNNNECKYFGCDVFYNLCSECFKKKYGEIEMKKKCKDNMESIVIRVEWNDKKAQCTWYNMITMPSLCSVKILFRILNGNYYHCNYLDLLDDGYNTHFKLQKFKQNDEMKRLKQFNEKCITDFGIISMSAMLLRL